MPRRHSNACNRKRINVAPSDGRPLIGTVFLGWCAGAALLVRTGCASTTITHVDATPDTDLSGHWNDADSRMVAEEMVKEALSGPWLETYARANNRRPVVVVGTLTNRSHEHINVQTFINDLPRALTNSGKVTFVAGKDEREEVRDERRDEDANPLGAAQKATGKG